jgi:hypothetical protein
MTPAPRFTTSAALELCELRQRQASQTCGWVNADISESSTFLKIDCDLTVTQTIPLFACLATSAQ